MRLVLWLSLVLLTVKLQAAEYDPLRATKDADVKVTDFTVSDTKRNRELPIRVYLPPKGPTVEVAPVVIFSHGLGGTREGSPFLGQHWAARGFVAVFVQHPGSDDSVWKDLPVAKRLAALQEAASVRNSILRMQDVPAVLDQLSKWNAEPTHVLAGRLNLKQVGMSGHSFGGQTTQAISGQIFGALSPSVAESRIKAAIIMSPSLPPRGDTKAAFAKVKVPWLLMTGTLDGGVVGNQTPETRRGVYPLLPSGDKFELVLNKAEHSAFTERALPGEKEPRNPNHHRVILATSTAFWDAFLRDDPTAKKWLTENGPRSVLETADVWQQK